MVARALPRPRTSRSCRACGPATAPGRPSTARRRPARRSRSPAATARRASCCTSSSHFGARARLRTPPPRPHVRARPARRHRRVLRRRPRRRARRRRTASTACTSAAPPRVGPDGRLRYGWDERIRLGRGRVLHVACTDTRRRAAGRHRTVRGLRARFVDRALRRHPTATITRVATASVWDVADA